MAQSELEVMAKVLALLEGYDVPTQARVVAWVSAKLGLCSQSTATPITASTLNKPSASIERVAAAQFRGLADLFDAIRPSTDIEKALVAGYWAQFGEGGADFVALEVNDALKQLGHPVTNITRALAGLVSTRPALVQQLRKSGGTKQARKTYRLTAAGQRHVEQMSGAAGSNSG